MIEEYDSIAEVLFIPIYGYNKNSDNYKYISKMKNLKKLEMINQDVDLSFLTNLKYLEVLKINLNATQLKTINFHSLKNIRELIIYGSFMGKIDNLDTCVLLENLTIKNSHIKKIENLDKLTNLKKLDLYDNDIQKIENLDCLTNLRKLILDKNCIKKIEGLEKTTKLQKLYLSYNPLTIIENIDHLSELKVIKINDTWISEEECKKLTEGKLGLTYVFDYFYVKI